MTQKHTSFTLVADVGGTNTRLALAIAGRVERTSVMRFANQGTASLQAVITRYLKDTNIRPPEAICVTIGGPVENGTGRLINLNWQITFQSLKDTNKAQQVSVINDLQAQAYALGYLPSSSCQTLLAGESDSAGTKLVIGTGTGSNAALALSTENDVVVSASETGHIALPVRSQADLDMVVFLRQIHDFVSVEHVLLGTGFENLHCWHTRHAPESKPLSAKEIMTAMADRSDTAAIQAVQSASRTLAHLCAKLSLIHLPFCGLYLVGGVARALTSYLSEFGFEHDFITRAGLKLSCPNFQ